MGYLHQNIHQDSSGLDEGHILLVLNTRLCSNYLPALVALLVY
jgi:hypothetical protein